MHFSFVAVLALGSFVGLGAAQTADNYLGCYQDVEGADTNSRVMELYLGFEGYNIETCLAECEELGFFYAGMQATNNCFCGDELDALGMLDDSQCDTPCANGPGICGGHWKNSVYATKWHTYFQEGVVSWGPSLRDGVKKVSTNHDGTLVYIIDENDDLYYKNEGDAGWTNVPGTLSNGATFKFRDVAVSGDGNVVWCLDTIAPSVDFPLIFWVYYKLKDDAVWTETGGIVSQISTTHDGQRVWSTKVHAQDLLYKDITDDWVAVCSDCADQVSVSGDGQTLWVQKDGDVFISTDTGATITVDSDAPKLKYVSTNFDGTLVYGATTYDHVFYQDTRIANAGWFRIDGSLAQLSLSGDDKVLWGRNDDMELYRGQHTSDCGWVIQPDVTGITAGFNEESTSEEIKVPFVFSGCRDYPVLTVLQPDCETVVESTVIDVSGVNGGYAPDDFAKMVYTGMVDIKNDEITNDEDLYIPLNTTHALITFCIKADLNYVDTVFNENLVMSSSRLMMNITLDKEKNFVTDILVEEEVEIEASKATELDYDVFAYMCSESDTVNPNTESVTDEDYMFICVTSPSEEAFVDEISSLTLSKEGQADYEPIRFDSVTGEIMQNSLTTTTSADGVKVIRSKLPATFFEDSVSVTANGMAIIGLGSGGGISRRRTAALKFRHLQESGAAEFSVEMGVVPLEAGGRVETDASFPEDMEETVQQDAVDSHRNKEDSDAKGMLFSCDVIGCAAVFAAFGTIVFLLKAVIDKTGLFKSSDKSTKSSASDYDSLSTKKVIV